LTAAGTSGESLADALAALGFERISRFGAAAWRGRPQGRDCKVSVSRQGRTHYTGASRIRQHLGYRLRIELETVVSTRLFFVKESVTSNAVVRWIYRWRQQAVVERTPPVLRGFQVVARDAPWAERLLAERDAMQDVAHLLTDGASSKLAGSVYFQPGNVYYGSPILQGVVTADRVVDVIRRLDGVARAAERIAAPDVVSQPTRFERFAKRRPAAFGCLLLGGCLAALIVLALLLAAAIGLVASRCGSS